MEKAPEEVGLPGLWRGEGGMEVNGISTEIIDPALLNGLQKNYNLPILADAPVLTL